MVNNGSRIEVFWKDMYMINGQPSSKYHGIWDMDSVAQSLIIDEEKSDGTSVMTSIPSANYRYFTITKYPPKPSI